MTKDQILAALPKLKPGDLQAIRAAAGALLFGQADSAPKALQGHQGWLFEALQASLKAPLSEAQFLATQAGKQFVRQAPGFITFMVKEFPDVMGKRVRALAMMKLLLDLIAADLRARQAPVTLGTIVVNLPRAREIFGLAFPGYLETGIAEMLIATMLRQ